jgi:hypothetical protein
VSSPTVSSIVRRTFASCPARSAHDTWQAVVDLLTKSCGAAARDELLSVSGEASSVISDQAPASAPIVVTADGPRTRIYCLYDDDALDGSNANESALGFDPLKGDWAVSLPCQAEDLDWVQAALKRKTKRIVARDMSDGTAIADSTSAATVELVLDPQGFTAS